MMILTGIIVWLLWHWKCCGGGQSPIAFVPPIVQKREIVQIYDKKCAIPKVPIFKDDEEYGHTVYPDIVFDSGGFHTYNMPYSYPDRDVISVDTGSTFWLFVIGIFATIAISFYRLK
jgi:hypothetical protein